jgi:hypothetical protein
MNFCQFSPCIKLARPNHSCKYKQFEHVLAILAASFFAMQTCVQAASASMWYLSVWLQPHSAGHSNTVLPTSPYNCQDKTVGQEQRWDRSKGGDHRVDEWWPPPPPRHQQQTQTKICPFWLLKGENLGSCDTFPYQHWIVIDRKRLRYRQKTVLLCEGVGAHVHMYTCPCLPAHLCTTYVCMCWYESACNCLYMYKRARDSTQTYLDACARVHTNVYDRIWATWGLRPIPC